MLYVCIKYTSADRGSIAILSFLLLNRRNQFFIVAQNIYECYGRVWQQMLFERHEFFRTVPDRCFRFTFISGSENHESHDKVSFIFSMSAKLFYGFEGQFSWNLERITRRKRRDEVYTPPGLYVLLRRRFQELRRFMANFLELPKQVINRATVNDCYWAFQYFFSKLFNRSFVMFEAIYRSLFLCEKLILILKYYFKYVNFTKNKSLSC